MNLFAFAFAISPRSPLIHWRDLHRARSLALSLSLSFSCCCPVRPKPPSPPMGWLPLIVWRLACRSAKISMLTEFAPPRSSPVADGLYPGPCTCAANVYSFSFTLQIAFHSPFAIRRFNRVRCTIVRIKPSQRL